MSAQVTVARHSVADAVRALEANPAAARAIGAAGKQIHDVFLCPRCLAEYFRRADIPPTWVAASDAAAV